MSDLTWILKDVLNHTSHVIWPLRNCLFGYWQQIILELSWPRNSVINSKSVKYSNNTFVSQSCWSFQKVNRMSAFLKWCTAYSILFNCCVSLFAFGFGLKEIWLFVKLCTRCALDGFAFGVPENSSHVKIYFATSKGDVQLDCFRLHKETLFETHSVARSVGLNLKCLG